MLSNNAETDSISCAITLNGFTPVRVTVQILTAATPDAHNDGAANAVILTDPDTLVSLPNTVALAPHSVFFLAFYRDAATSVASPSPSSPQGFALQQNYPNPFNPSTTIQFSFSLKEYVTLKVFDILGREVATLLDDELSGGSHSVVFEAKNLTSGVYFYRFDAGQFTQIRKALLMK